MSEILEYDPNDESNIGKSEEAIKQDCESKAFKRLAGRLKKACPHLKIMALLDGLYANGPIVKLCRKYKWQFMIVLQDKCLKDVWEDANFLIKLEPRNTFEKKWRGRQQVFTWANDIEYYYDNDKKKVILHVVVCHETWEEVDKKTNEIVTRKSKHAWVSSESIDRFNVHERCNLAGRHRWNIEHSFLEEKHGGYQYEHCFSYNWNAMKGYHYIMRIAHALNVMARYTKIIAKYVKQMGQRAFIDFIRISYQMLALADGLQEYIAEKLSESYQVRLV